MTNAIEVTKREMCLYIKHVKNCISGNHVPYSSFPSLEKTLEAHLEAHLEALRQETEGLRGDVRTAESAHDTVEAMSRLAMSRIGEMTQERRDLLAKYDALGKDADQRFRDLQAAEEANAKLQEIIRISGEELRNAQMLNRSYARQLAGAEGGPELMTVLGALVDAQRIMTDWLVPDGVRARDTVKALIPVLDNQVLVLAMRSFEKTKTGE